jgi:peptide chain release factor 2
VLLELAEEAGDGSLDAEIGEGVAGLAKDLDEYELKIMLSGPHDTKAAIVSIHPGAGGHRIAGLGPDAPAHVPALV